MTTAEQEPNYVLVHQFVPWMAPEDHLLREDGVCPCNPQVMAADEVDL